MGLLSGKKKKLKVATVVQVYFQKYPGTDAATGIQDLDYEFTPPGGKPIKGRTGRDGATTFRLREGEIGRLDILGTIYYVKVRTSVESIDDLKGQQRRLQMIGYGPGPVDGVNGPKTDRAMQNFQGDNNPLDTQGIADANTKTKLKSAAGV